MAGLCVIEDRDPTSDWLPRLILVVLRSGIQLSADLQRPVSILPLPPVRRSPRDHLRSYLEHERQADSAHRDRCIEFLPCMAGNFVVVQPPDRALLDTGVGIAHVNLPIDFSERLRSFGEVLRFEGFLVTARSIEGEVVGVDPVPGIGPIATLIPGLPGGLIPASDPGWVRCTCHP